MPTKVQSFVKTFNSSIPAQAFATLAPTAGNAIVCICLDNGAGVISAPTHNTVGSSALTLAVTRAGSGGTVRASGYVITAPAGASTLYTITGHYSVAAVGELMISEWSGLLNPVGVNSSAGSTAALSTGNSGSLTMSSANCQLLAAIVDNSGANPATFSTQGGWQQTDIQTDAATFMGGAVANLPVSGGSSALTTGSYQSSWTFEGSLAYAGIIFALLPDGTGAAVTRGPRFTMMGAGR